MSHREVDSEASRTNEATPYLIEYSFEARDQEDDTVEWITYRRYQSDKAVKGALHHLELMAGGMCVFRVKV